MDVSTQLSALRSLSGQAELMTEGGRSVVFLPQVKFDAGGLRATRNLLLWPSARDNYTTRLFLSAQVKGSIERVWTSYNLCGGTWWAVSWQGVPATLPWVEMLASHLRAFK
jgi:hypothetical protein